ncbi:MAG: hypothetical protein JWP97_4465 [Labilithrix sp.]|nr:hypothetical protein [Labilithrix sp.]
MATRLHVGAKELKGELGAYAKRFDLLEVRGYAAADLRQAPSDATLRRWRKAAGPQFEFAAVAGPALSRLKDSADLETELAALLKTVTLLEARIILVGTPSDVTPSKLWRDRLAKVIERLPRDASTVVWEPSGLWETEDAAEQARQWGVVVAVDPARDAMPPGPVAYGRLRAQGATRAFSTTALTKIAMTIGERRDAYVVIETANALKEGKQLRALVRAAKTGAQGGLGRLIRPRGASADDEAEDDDE